MTNPILLVEVTSPSTEEYHRGEKLSHYQQLPSLQTVLFVSHRAREVTVFAREGTEWRRRDFGTGARVELLAPAVAFGVDEVHEALAGL